MILLPSLILPEVVVDSTSFSNLLLMHLPSGDATHSDNVSSLHNEQLENVQNLVFSVIICMLFSNLRKDLQYSSHIFSERKVCLNT